MSMRATLKRVQKIEQRLSPGDGLFTLEELYRAIWREDRTRYRQMSTGHLGTGMSVLLPVFEREDAERAGAK